MKSPFSKIQRLLKTQEYRELYNNGKKYLGNKVLIFYQLNNSTNPKLGITIKKKWGKAHTRNRFKRIVRESFRKEFSGIPLNINLNIHPRKDFENLTLQEITHELKNLVEICGTSQFQSTTSCQNR